MNLKAPFPWFGGKSAIAAEVWTRFGDVTNYVEPFAGSAAVLLKRPLFEGNRIETINDADGNVANFWRALQADPDAVAQYADWPVSELDLHARGDWLFYRRDYGEFVERLRADPDYYDAKAAGWWVWFVSSWIGGLPNVGIHRQLPHLGNAGKGVNRQLPHLGDAGKGVNRQLLHLRNAGMGDYLTALADRLRRVRVCCGDWSRVTGPSVTFKLGLTGVFLDPPYSAEAGRNNNLYSVDDGAVAYDVREWAIANGDNPLMRIALCGYDSEHEKVMPDNWHVYRWKALGGYGLQSGGRGRANSARETVWFSPHCINPIETLPIFSQSTPSV